MVVFVLNYNAQQETRKVGIMAVAITKHHSHSVQKTIPQMPFPSNLMCLMALSVSTYAESHDLNAEGVSFLFNHPTVEERCGLKQHNPVLGKRNFRNWSYLLVMSMTQLMS